MCLGNLSSGMVLELEMITGPRKCGPNEANRSFAE